VVASISDNSKAVKIILWEKLLPLEGVSVNSDAGD
jgi:hypothetical protein